MNTQPKPARRPEPPANSRPGGILEGRFREALESSPAGERRLRLEIATIDRAAAMLVGEGARFIGVLVCEQPERSLLAAFALRGELVALRAPLAGHGAYPSLGLQLPAARLAERELHGLHGLVPLGHPDLEPVLRPSADDLRRRVHGPGSFVIPYGPVRSGVFEAIQFVIDTGGEDVLAAEVRPFFKRRELEARFRGLALERGPLLAERVAGIASVAHATAFSQAVESALGVEAPRRAAMWRSVLAELERIANHLDVAARLPEDTALSVGSARFAILKEDVLRLQARLTGSRFSRGVVVPGGIRFEPATGLEAFRDSLDRLERDLDRDQKLLLRTTSFTDRLIGTGRLDRETVESFGGVGPVARACGLSVDARFERPYDAYRWLGFDVPTRVQGDAMARLEVRLREIRESLHLIRQAIDSLGRRQGPIRAELPGGGGTGFGWSEAPQGELVYWVEIEDSRLGNVHVLSPSFRNWPLFSESFRGDVLTDFAFIEHSFGLTPAGADR
jgi:formate hydrogenlyase subunit 5